MASRAGLIALIGAAALTAMALPAAVLPIAGPPQSARVIFFDIPDPAALPDTVSIDRWDGHLAILAGVDAHSARALYALGAAIVYPVRTAGCLALSRT